jgi:hypothetical protein
VDDEHAGARQGQQVHPDDEEDDLTRSGHP